MQRLPRLLVCLALCLPLLCAGSAAAAETAAVQAAQNYADNETAHAPVHGNLPDYSLAPDALLKAQHLARIHQLTYFVDVVWGIVQLLLLLSLGVVASMRDRALRFRNRWLQGFTFTFLVLLADFVLNLPLEMYLHHVSRSFGLSVEGWAGWMGDHAKGFALEWGIAGLLLMLLMGVLRKLPRFWWLAFWVCTIPITLFGAFISPYIEPLFFHYEPLARSHPELVQRLEQVVAKGHMQIPPDRMFLMQASSKLTTLNADVEGFGHSKRVVVWDTSIQKLSPDGILFVFGHESGHYVLGHVARGLAMSFLGSFVLLFIASRALRWTLARFGERWRIPSQADWGAAAVLVLILAVINTAAGPFVAAISRTQEHAADIYGQEAIHGLVADPQATAQLADHVLGATSFADPAPPRWYTLLTYDHPAIGWRAAFAHAYNPWAPGASPRYFPRETQP